MFAMDDSWGAPTVPTPQESIPAPEADADLEVLLQQVALQPAAAKPKSCKRATAAPAGAAPAAAEQPAPGGVELGFVSACDDEWLQPHHFPSKVGGEPVWLAPAALPPDEALTCGACSRPMRFLLQLYCPRPDVPHAFHRSLMLFCCGGRCLGASTGWRALRCNLPASTPFYEEQPDGSYVAHERQQLRPSPSVRSALPQLWISVGMEGDWREWLSYYDRGDEARAAAALARYEEERRAEDKGGGAAAEAEGRCAARHEAGEAQGGEGAEGAGRGGGGAAEEEEEEGWGQGGFRSRPPPSAARGGMGGMGDMADERDEGEDTEGEEDGFDEFQRRVSAWPDQALRFSRYGTEPPLWLSAKRRAPPPPPCGRCGEPSMSKAALLAAAGPAICGSRRHPPWAIPLANHARQPSALCLLTVYLLAMRRRSAHL